MERRETAVPAATLTLETPVQYVKGVGPRRAAGLSEAGIHTVSDLLGHAPFRYEDRSRFRRLDSLQEGEWALTKGRISSTGSFEGRRGGISVFELLLRDKSAAITLKFFNQPYLRKVFKEGLDLVVYGQVKRDAYGRRVLCFLNPECEILKADAEDSVHTGRVVPVYRKLAGLPARSLRQIMFHIVYGLQGDSPDSLPTGLRKKLRLMTAVEALKRVHFPELRSSDSAERDREMAALNRGLSAAHKRLIFEELFRFQGGLALMRAERVSQSKPRRVRLTEAVRRAIKRILPFHPTEAQKRVLGEIAEDMASSRPMSRLLQGDVGSGKTIVAAQAGIIAVENGFQVAIMAPTEILAEQHYFNFRHLLRPLGYGVVLLKGSLRTKEKREAAERIRTGEAQVVIGTHALIQGGVRFRDLGLVVVDEQHRFGVVQRGALKEKGGWPDMLVMTATPIPRSLALTLYGDLDVSVIDCLPPGRQPVETLRLTEAQRERAYGAIREAVKAGNQVYVVYPLVEESEKSDLRAATEMAERLDKEMFPECRVGLLHGKLKGSEKESVMAAFAEGLIRILVATTVIEVGVDVPNATLMVIEHAERFGLAQLHQLRGRVGRGAARSRCILIARDAGNPEARRRLDIMCETNDGFRIAEVDLELRGPGEIAGTRQSGLPALRYANLVRDRRALEVAREEAQDFVSTLRSRPDAECRRIAEQMRVHWQQTAEGGLVG